MAANVANEAEDDDLPVISTGERRFTGLQQHRRLPASIYSALDRAEETVRRDANDGRGGGRGGRRRPRDYEDDDDGGNGDDSGGGGGGGGGGHGGAGGGGGQPEIKYVPAPFYQELINRLGPRTLRNTCFGCKYVGQHRASKIPDHRLGEILETMAEGIGVSDPYYLAHEVSAMYEKMRTSVNETRGKQDPLPPWTAGGVWWHWVSHTDDPQIWKWICQWVNKSVVFDILGRSMCKVNVATGEVVYDKDQYGIMEKAMVKSFFVSKQDARKMDYYFDGAMINTQVMANGGVHRHRRPGYVFFKNTRKKPRTATASANVLFDDDQ